MIAIIREVGKKSTFNISLITCLVLGAFISPNEAKADSQTFVASGLATTWHIKKDYGENSYSRFGIEIPTFVYLNLMGPLYIRPGLRLGFTSDNPEMPIGLTVSERDLSASGEVGVLFDWYVIPSLTGGWGVIRRSISLKTGSNVDTSGDRISSTELLNFWSIQLGVGVPFFDGRIVFEPIARYMTTDDDERGPWVFGGELTFSLF